MSESIYVAYAGIVAMALWPIYVGCHRSLRVHGLRLGPHAQGYSVGFKAPESESKEDVMTHKDAYMFPVYGSGALFGLYTLIKIFSKEWVNLLLTFYFIVLGIFSVVLPDSIRKVKFDWSLKNLPFYGPLEVKFSGSDLVGTVFGALVAVWYSQTKHWISNNIFGLAFSIQGIERMPIGSYGIGCILLSGLFFYDIFWVFGTDVMVTVAKGLEAPIKLLFPKDIFAAEYQFSMLGLGDIVIPGIFLAMLLRFDAVQAFKSKAALARTYFTVTFVAYTIGLLTTIFIMHFFAAAQVGILLIDAQPALLYLVPACILSSFAVALVKGDTKSLFAYSDDNPTGEKEQKKE